MMMALAWFALSGLAANYNKFGIESFQATLCMRHKDSHFYHGKINFKDGGEVQYKTIYHLMSTLIQVVESTQYSPSS